MKDYYKVLGVAEDASQEDIKKVFRKLAVDNHPDHGGNEERFKEYNEAYSVLSDPDKRNEYNMMRSGGGPLGFDPFNFFNQHFNFGGRRQSVNPNAPIKGQNLEYVFDIPFKHFILGGSITVNLDYKDICDVCNGSGASESEVCSSCNGTGSFTQRTNNNGMVFVQTGPCTTCRGSGKKTTKKCPDCVGGFVAMNKEIVIDIPKNSTDQLIIRKSELGLKGRNGGPNGDVFIQFRMVMPREENLTDEQRKVIESL